MEKQYLVKLVCVSYKLTQDFFEDEPLRACIRQKALDILVDYSTKEKNKKVIPQLLENIKAIKAYLEVAQDQEMAESAYFTVLIKEYSNMEQEVKDLAKSQKSAIVKRKPVVSGQEQGFLKQRHQKIIEILKKQDSAQIKDFKQVMPEVTKRTLRRDVDELLQKKLIERRGVRNSTVYVLKKA